MKTTQDMMRKEYSIMAAENVRLTNINSRQASRIKFLEGENACLVSELNEAERRCLNLEMSDKALREKCKSLESRIAELESKLSNLDALAKEAGTDFESVVNLIRHRTFNTNSNASRYLNGEVGVSDERLSGLNLNDLVKEITERYVDGGAAEGRKEGTVKCGPKPKRGRGSVKGVKKPRRVYTANLLSRMGIDTSNLPAGSKLIRRRRMDGTEAYDEWVVVVYDYVPGNVGRREYVIGRFNVPGDDPRNSKGPQLITEGAYVSASFARFYFVSKIELGLSESRILEMFKSMHADIPQATLNNWMHKVMGRLREALQGPMLEEVRKSAYMQNDETRIDVRSVIDGKEKYYTEYIHGCVSTERGIVVMLYEEGSRSASVQLRNIFEGSLINAFTGDRAAIYGTIGSRLVEYGVIRSACWFHGRHYLVDAYISDKRMGPLIEMTNTLFRIERECVDKPEWLRLQYRRKYSLPIVDAIMRRLKAIRGDTSYGTLAQRAARYILDDEQAFRMFLADGRIMMHNNTAERMFRHIAMGRRNWLHSGSHDGARNIAFMYSLLESCKLNGLDFGDYIEDVMTRLAEGDTDHASMIACNYKPRQAEAKAKTA